MFDAVFLRFLSPRSEARVASVYICVHVFDAVFLRFLSPRSEARESAV